MPKALNIVSQTEFADSLLAELSDLATDPVVNFNSTKQFDVVLRHLETSLAAPKFVVAPSTEILHILFTLCTRTAASNWSHDSLHAFAGDTSQYMQHVNRAYDSALHKPSLQQRSAAILRRYLEILARGKIDADALSVKGESGKNDHSVEKFSHTPGPASSPDKLPSNEEKTPDSAFDVLFARMEDVLAAFSSSDIALFFAENKGISLSPAKSSQPRLMRLKNGRKAKKKAQQMLNEMSDEDTPQMDVPAPVEVISDSDEPGAAPVPASQADVYAKLKQVSFASASMPSFSDLSTNVSGLGETATLFQQMPHLSAPDTPSSEVEAASQNTEDAAPAKKRRKKSPPSDQPWRRIQVFDDHVISRKLSASANYDVWSFLRWTLWCADNSAQYQKFLFDASSTHVHHTYAAGRDFLVVFFGLCHVQLKSWTEAPRGRSAVIAHHLLGLGPKHEWPERAINHVFAGLGVPSSDKPYPSYEREVHLTKSDATVLNSRCKTVTQNDDNMDSVRLRVHMIYLLLDFEFIKMYGTEMLPEKDRPLSISLGLLTLPSYIVTKLTKLPVVYLESFLRSLSSEVAVCAGRSTVMRDVLFATKLASFFCLGLINDITGLKKTFQETDYDGEVDLTMQVADLLTDPQLYRSLVDDVTVNCIEDFVAQWKKLMFVAEWLFGLVLSEAQPWQKSTILHKAEVADQLASAGYAEFIDSRSESSDVLLDTTFTLTAGQVEHFSGQWQCSFSELAQFKLMMNGEDPPQKIMQLKPVEDSVSVRTDQKPTFYIRQSFNQPEAIFDIGESSSSSESEVEVSQVISDSTPFGSRESIMEVKGVSGHDSEANDDLPQSDFPQSSQVQAEHPISQADIDILNQEFLSDFSDDSVIDVTMEHVEPEDKNLKVSEKPSSPDPNVEASIHSSPVDSEATIDKEISESPYPVDSQATVSEEKSESPDSGDSGDSSATVDEAPHKSHSPVDSNQTLGDGQDVPAENENAEVEAAAVEIPITDRTQGSSKSDSKVDEVHQLDDENSDFDEFQSFTEIQPETSAPSTNEMKTSELPSGSILEEPKASEPIVGEPIVSASIATEPIVTEPVVAEPIVTEPTTPEPTTSEPRTSERTTSESTVSDQETPSTDSKTASDAQSSKEATSETASSKEMAIKAEVGLPFSPRDLKYAMASPTKRQSLKSPSKSPRKSPTKSKGRLIKNEHSGRKVGGQKMGMVSKPKFDIVSMLMHSRLKSEPKETVAGAKSNDEPTKDSATESKADVMHSAGVTESAIEKAGDTSEPNTKPAASVSEKTSEGINHTEQREIGSPVPSSSGIAQSSLSGLNGVPSSDIKLSDDGPLEEEDPMDDIPLSRRRKVELNSREEVPLSQLCRN